jgi:hypothetical protein
MNSSFEAQFHSQLDALPVESAAFAYASQESAMMGARACVVNRTHRVVRERAKSLHERRSKARSLMIPLAICCVLLILVCAGVWTGLYQYEATEAAVAVQADVAALDANNHLLVILLWFVPAMLAFLGGVLFRLTRNSSDRRTIR